MAESTDPSAKENSDVLLNEIQKKITDAFDIFDHEANKTVDISIYNVNAHHREMTIVVENDVKPQGEDVNAQTLKSVKMEVGTIIRSLGCCPSEAELQELLNEVEEEEPTGYVRLEKFLPMMTKIIVERKYQPVREDVLIKAFRVLDVEDRGYLTQEELAKYMTEEGEPFTSDELEEMMSQAFDPERGYIPYKEYAYLMIDEETLL